MEINGYTYEKPIKIYKNVDIGRDSFIGKYTYIRPYSYTNSKTKIGRYCSIGDFVIIGASKHPTNWISTHTFQYDTKTKFPNSDLYEKVSPIPLNLSEETIIGNDVWIGSRAIIMQGLVIGDGAIIGAGAIITKDVAPYSIVVGFNNTIKKRFDENIINKLLILKWWDLSNDIVSQLPFNDIEKCITFLESNENKA